MPPAIAGDPAFSSSCNSTPSRASIGPFQTQPGDCFVSYQITAQQLSDFHANYSSPMRAQVLADVRANFADRVDSIVVIVDESSSEQGTLPYGINFGVQNCNVHAPSCPRFGRLGNVWLTARDYLLNGPALHELLHGWHTLMAPDTAANYTIPTAVDAHWGYSSAGGQHGGWRRDTLVSLGGGTYRAQGPTVYSGYIQPTGFGINANGGNSVPYSNLELWTMGLIPDSELQAVDVAENATFTAAGTFTASAITTYSPTQIIARVLPTARPSTSTPRAFRALVVLVSTRATPTAELVTSLNSDIEQFTMRSTPTRLVGHNFWTATGLRASLQMANASEIANP